MSEPSEPEPAFSITRVEKRKDLSILFAGTFSFDDATAIAHEVHAAVTPAPEGKVRFDLSKVESMDGGVMALVVQAHRDLTLAGKKSKIVGARGPVKKILALYDSATEIESPKREKPLGILNQIGRGTIAFFASVKQVLDFLGGMVLAFGGIIRRPRTANWREIPALMNRTGADAVPIVILINSLVGFVMGYQSAAQLKQFGANIFVADLVGLSITRELGPLMTAIILSGRSGAAFAAELGTMKVSEEIDALRTLGFDPMRYLVFPRMVALFLIAPLLTMMANFVALLGGLAVGVISLDLTILGYLHETRDAMRMWDVFQGVIKSGVFALAIGLVSCQQGLATEGGAEGVGRRTTSSVVASLFALILIDAAFTVLFHAVKI